MAAKNTAPMLSAMASDASIRIIELLSEGDMSLKQLVDKTGLPKEEILEHTKEMEECGLVISTEDDDYITFCIDAKQFAMLTGFFELILNRCSPPKCC